MRLTLQERDRRYEAIREEMEKERIDVLVIQGGPDVLRMGNVRYVTDTGVITYGQHVIFPLDGEPVFFLMANKSEHNHNRWIKDFAYHGGVASGKNAVSDLAKKFHKGGKIGLVKGSGFSIGDVLVDHALHEDLTGAFKEKVVLADHLYQKIRMIKSAEEITMIRKSAEIGDQALQCVVDNLLHEGTSDFEIMGAVSKISLENGCDYNFFWIDAYKEKIGFTFPVGNKLSKGGTLVLELSPSYQGYYSQSVLTLPVDGRYSENMQCLLAIWEEAYTSGEDKIKIGNCACDVANAITGVYKKYGIELRADYGHGLGLGPCDGWVFSTGDTTELQPGMTFVLHPKVVDKNNDGVFMGFAYIMTENGPERIDNIDYQQIINSKEYTSK